MTLKGKYIGVKVSEMMTTPVVHLMENQTILSAAQVFSRSRISGAPVKNEANQYVGVLSRTDLFSKGILKKLQLDSDYMESTFVGQIIEKRAPITVCGNLFAEEAADIMLSHKIHRVFVTADDSDEIIGVLSSYDVMAILSGCGTLNEINDTNSFCCLCGNKLSEELAEPQSF